MHTPTTSHIAPILRRVAWCLLPLTAGLSAALALLLVAGGRARPVYASTLTYPGCGGSIQACIDLASAGDTILITAGDYTESLTLSKAVSLTGALSSTTILHALPNTRVLTVTGAAVDSSVVISGLTFTGGNVTGASSCPQSCGGGLLITGTAQPQLNALVITGNVAGALGGGLFAASGSPLALSDVDFMNNTAVASGGGADAQDRFIVANSLFEGNQVTAGGAGGIGGSSDVVLTNTDILSSATYAGPAGMFGYTLTVSGGLIQGNHCSLYDCFGGGLSTNVLSMTGTRVVSNSAGVIGGAFAWYANLTNVLFEGNQGTYHVDGIGGLVVPGVLTATDTDFINNFGVDSGGGALIQGAATFQGGRFQGNGSGTSGGGLFVDQASLNMTGTLFIDNTAVGGGGGLYTNDSSGQHLRIVNTLFAGNSSGGPGQAIELSSNSLTSIVNSTIASPTLGSGAAIVVGQYNFDSPVLGMTNTIVSNYATGISLTSGSAYEDGNLYFGVTTPVAAGVTSGGHSLIGDPLFVNPASGDYHLGIGSLAVDAGFDSGVTTDFEGDPRPQGNGFDIGFDESPYTATVDVAVVKTASTTTPQRGQTLTYTLVFSNAGQYIAAGVRLTDIVPANLTTLTYTNSGAALTPVGGLTYAWQVADLAPGAGGIITVTGVLGGSPRGAVFTNTATLTTTTADSDVSNNTSAVSVTVANAAPVAVADVYAVAQNGVLTVTAPGVLGNDTDANNDVLTAGLSAGPLTGMLGLQADGAFTFTPPLGFGGLVTFTYQASDGELLSAPATVTLDVNQRPVANAGLSQSAIVGQPIALDGSGSSDPDNNLPLTYGWRQTGGTAVILSGATLSRSTFTGPAAPAVLTFTLVVTDASGLAGLPATTTVTVTDQAVTGLSAAGGSPRVLGSSTPFTATIGAGTNVTYAWGFGDGTAPGSGALVSHAYSTPGGFEAVVTATNSLGHVTATTTVTVVDEAITGLNAASTSPTVFGLSTAFTATASHGTNVTYAWGYGDGTAPGSGAAVNHTYGLPGAYTAVLTATNSASQVTATTMVTVDDVPIAASDAFTTPEDTPLQVLAAGGVLANDSDSFPGGLTAHLVAGPPVGALALAPSGAFTYTPPLNFNGLVTFTYQANDGLFGSPPAVVSITVQPVNDPPTISGLHDVTTTVGMAAGPLSFTVGDVETPAGALTVTAQSSNSALVPNGSIVVGGSGAARTVTITPAAGETGTATITLTVSDGSAITSETFVFTVVQGLAEHWLYLPLLTR